MADPFGLGGYASDAAVSSSSDDSDSDASSVDSAQQRAAAAAARLRDYGAEQAATSSAPKAASGLPSAAAMFSAVGGKPSYLDPEATRPIAVSSTHGLAGMGGSAAAPGAQQQQGRAFKKTPATDFDISQLAPKLKGQQQQPGKRGVPPGAVIEGKAKRYKAEDEAGSQQYTAAQVAMMGGNVDAMLDGSSEQVAGGAKGRPGPAPAPAAAGGGKPDRGPATKAMPVGDFMDRGPGGAVLPRKQQMRKDKEKEKRAKGQSTAVRWRSEQEMALRQQYD